MSAEVAATKATKAAKATKATKATKVTKKTPGLTSRMRETLEGIGRSTIFGLGGCFEVKNVKELIDRGLVVQSAELPPADWERRTKAYCAYTLTPEGICALGAFAPELQKRIEMDNKDGQIWERLSIVAPELTTFFHKPPSWSNGTQFVRKLRDHGFDLGVARLAFAGPLLNALHPEILDEDLQKAEALVARLRVMKKEIATAQEEHERLKEEAKAAGDDLLGRALGATVYTWPKVHGNWGNGRWID